MVHLQLKISYLEKSDFDKLLDVTSQTLKKHTDAVKFACFQSRFRLKTSI